MQSSHEIETQINVLENKLTPLEGLAKEKLQQFTRQLPPHVITWMEKETQRRIEENPEQVTNIGIDNLSALKQELIDLHSRVPDLCVQALEKHLERKNTRRVSATTHKSRSESFFASIFREAISHLGTILDKYDLLQSSDGKLNSWEKIGGQVQYKINPGFDERNFVCIAEYKDLRAQQSEISTKLENKRIELSKAKARELWDSV